MIERQSAKLARVRIVMVGGKKKIINQLIVKY